MHSLLAEQATIEEPLHRRGCRTLSQQLISCNATESLSEETGCIRPVIRVTSCRKLDLPPLQAVPGMENVLYAARTRAAGSAAAAAAIGLCCGHWEAQVRSKGSQPLLSPALRSEPFPAENCNLGSLLGFSVSCSTWSAQASSSWPHSAQSPVTEAAVTCYNVPVLCCWSTALTHSMQVPAAVKALALLSRSGLNRREPSGILQGLQVKNHHSSFRDVVRKQSDTVAWSRISTAVLPCFTRTTTLWQQEVRLLSADIRLHFMAAFDGAVCMLVSDGSKNHHLPNSVEGGRDQYNEQAACPSPHVATPDCSANLEPGGR